MASVNVYYDPTSSRCKAMAKKRKYIRKFRRGKVLYKKIVTELRPRAIFKVPRLGRHPRPNDTSYHIHTPGFVSLLFAPEDEARRRQMEKRLIIKAQRAAESERKAGQRERRETRERDRMEYENRERNNEIERRNAAKELRKQQLEREGAAKQGESRKPEDPNTKLEHHPGSPCELMTEHQDESRQNQACLERLEQPRAARSDKSNEDCGESSKSKRKQPAIPSPGTDSKADEPLPGQEGWLPMEEIGSDLPPREPQKVLHYEGNVYTEDPMKPGYSVETGKVLALGPPRKALVVPNLNYQPSAETRARQEKLRAEYSKDLKPGERLSGAHEANIDNLVPSNERPPVTELIPIPTPLREQPLPAPYPPPPKNRTPSPSSLEFAQKQYTFIPDAVREAVTFPRNCNYPKAYQHVSRRIRCGTLLKELIAQGSMRSDRWRLYIITYPNPELREAQVQRGAETPSEDYWGFMIAPPNPQPKDKAVVFEWFWEGPATQPRIPSASAWKALQKQDRAQLRKDMRKRHR